MYKMADQRSCMSRCLTIFCSTKLVALVYEPRTKEEEKNVERLKFKQNEKEVSEAPRRRL